MADYQAIADVTRTLRTLLLDRVEHPEKFGVTTVPPDISEPERQNEGRWINLYLYQVIENASLKNQEIPPAPHPGAYGRPPLSLDLHYLMTARSPSETALDSDIDAQLLLGSAMRVFHEVAVVTEDLAITRSNVGVIGEPILGNSLRGEFEKVKLTLAPLNMDDLSKIWTALPQGNFRRSVAYQVSVIQIESSPRRQYPRRVGEPPEAGPRVYTIPAPSPRIDEIRVRRDDEEGPYPYARVGDTLVLLGHGFAGAGTGVRIGSNHHDPDVHQERRIEIELPDDVSLQPGPQTVQIYRGLDMGQPPRPHVGFQSNLALFMLVPRVNDLMAVLGPTLRSLRIQGERLYLDNLGGEILIGDALATRDWYLGTPSPTEVIIPLPDSLPDWPATTLLSGDLSSFPDPAVVPTEPLGVTVGTNSTHEISLLESPNNLSAAAATLQAALRAVDGGGPGFRGARVTTLGSRLAVIPGGLRDSCSMVGGTADALHLSFTHGAETSRVYLSGRLEPFPQLTSTTPQVNLRVDGVTHLLSLETTPSNLVDAAELLRIALRGAGFAAAQVAVSENQLIILVGDGATEVRFMPVPGADETTGAELRLRTAYKVRVRVNGAEDIDNRSVELP